VPTPQSTTNLWYLQRYKERKTKEEISAFGGCAELLAIAGIIGVGNGAEPMLFWALL